MSMRTMVVALILAVAFSGAALANPIIDFGTGSLGAGGTISWAGGTAPLVGSGILIGVVAGVNTPSNAGGHTVTSGTLNFSTGSFASFSGGTYTFNGGGTFTITGGVPDALIANGTTLMSGSFTSATMSSGTVNLFLGNGTDTKDPTLVAFFGLTPGIPFMFSGFSITTGSVPSGSASAFSTTAFSTDISNTALPEPGTITLLGTGLLALAGLVRRQFAA